MKKGKHESDDKSGKRKPVLADHEKRNKGKLLVPPLVAAVGPFSYVSWIETIIPETVWIGLLHEMFGENEGTSLALDLAKTASEIARKSLDGFFFGASEYAALTDAEKPAIVRSLSTTGKLPQIQTALAPLFHNYPMCPLNFLRADHGSEYSDHSLTTLKTVLLELFEKQTRRAVMVQATVVYIAFVSGRLKVAEGLSLAHFPEVEKYPTTEMSRRVAASARCAVLTFFGEDQKIRATNWPVEFWNRGMEIESCSFNQGKAHG